MMGKSFAEVLISHRERKGLSRAALARRMGTCSRKNGYPETTLIWRWEHGQSEPTLYTLRQLTKVFGVEFLLEAVGVEHDG